MKRILITLCLVTCVFLASIVFAVPKNTVYIYKDEGVSNESLSHTTLSFKNLLDKKYVIKTIDAEQVKHGLWTRDAVLFVIPGGADLPYAKKLNGKGNDVIKRYVKDGGSLLGICAGSYYCSSCVEFDKNGPLEVLGDRELSFFKGKAIGPVLAPYDYKTQSGTRAAIIRTTLKEVPDTVVFYNGGGYFANVANCADSEVIATYENNLPAIILITYGKGKVLLSGVHFEYDPSLLSDKDIFIQKIIEELNKNNASRKILFNTLMQMLGVK